jgi:hypothetical protein
MQASPPKIRGTQSGLKKPSAVGEIKAAMRAGTFRFEEFELRIGGVRDRRGVYHVVEGHIALSQRWNCGKKRAMQSRSRSCLSAATGMT